MQKSLVSIVKDKERNTYEQSGMIISIVPTVTKGFTLAKELLYTLVDSKTVLYLSGGRTPKELYKDLAHEEVLRPGAIGLVDERFGDRFHDKSNEKMLKETGLLRYTEMRGIPFYPILQENKSRRDSANSYDEQLRRLNTTYQKSIATLGIGLDGHTAGIAGNRSDSSLSSGQAFHNPMFDAGQKDVLVSEYNDEFGTFRERISMTFLGLSMMDIIVVLVFGQDKKDAIRMMFSDGPEEDIPSRFLKRPEIAKKTVLITDQNIL
jgi:6-phosphogluconolactonase/glucosamine-6-phosphate isomerase/deaminase